MIPLLARPASTALVSLRFDLLIICALSVGASTMACDGPTGDDATLEVDDEGDDDEDDDEDDDDEPQTSDDAFDVRLVRVEPNVHVGTQQSCDVSFVGTVAEVDERIAERYPDSATRRVAVKCSSTTGEGWADLVTVATSDRLLPQVAQGRRIQIRMHADGGGFSDYPIVELRDVVGAAYPRPRPTAEAPSPAFDFSRLEREHRLVGSERSCGVDFASNIKRIGDLDRRRHPYADDHVNRMSVKCLAEDAESWIDLVFTQETARDALGIRRGRTIQVQILHNDEGEAGRPLTQWVPVS